MTHYETLGVPADAPPERIRDAYRRLARDHHPDRDRSGAVGSMAAINEAYRVLRDPARRAVYDATLRGSAVGPVGNGRSASATAPRSPRPPVAPLPPGRFPWKMLGLMATVGCVVVIVGAILRGPAEEPAPDNLLGPGSCVVIETNGDAREVPCSTPDHLVVVELVPFDGRCPAGTDAHRDRQGRGTACVDPAPVTPTTS